VILYIANKEEDKENDLKPQNPEYGWRGFSYQNTQKNLKLN
jgi:hypothetical protein